MEIDLKEIAIKIEAEIAEGIISAEEPEETTQRVMSIITEAVDYLKTRRMKQNMDFVKMELNDMMEVAKGISVIKVNGGHIYDIYNNGKSELIFVKEC